MALGNGKQAVSPQAEEYLEAVCRILDRGETATPTELARELAISPPSVLGMIRRLAEQGLLTYSRQDGARLTAQGRERADALRRRHRLAERLLTDVLGVPWARVHEIACRFEHVIDDEVEVYLDAALNHPDTCPHGNPLRAPEPHAWRALTALAPGQTGTLRCVQDETADALDYLSHAGLQPGARVTVCDRAPFDGPLTVEVEGARHALSPAMAGTLLVETEDPD